jgi:CubicO group peptidase (beta-lactamase class C family)
MIGTFTEHTRRRSFAISAEVEVGKMRGAGRNRRRIVLALGAALSLLTGCTSTYVGRWVTWNFSDIEDHRRFPSLPVETGTATFRFHEVGDPAPIEIEVERRERSAVWELGELARSTATTALIVIRADTILFEGYFNGHDRGSINTSFSVAKSITALLIGLAIDRGWIGSIDDPVTRYVPELLARDERFERLTIAHLLDMRSGLRWRDHDFVTGDKPRAYYHPRLRRLLLSKVPLVSEPGERWQYNSYNPILLGVVLERATGHNAAELLEAWLWRRLGMEYPASWSVDGPREPMVKMESGINARAIDFAKLGRLMLTAGLWNGERAVPASWIEGSTRAEHGCALEAYRPREVCYRRAWWVYPPTDTTHYAFGATGHLGQYIFVFPELQLVFVRFGRNTGGVSWPAVFRAIATELAGREVAARGRR